jgi:hypothetical protein
MKQKDVVVIVIVIIVSGIFSVLISNVFLKSSINSQTAEVVQSINSSFDTPSSTYFNSNSINPTQIISIGNYNNPNPF